MGCVALHHHVWGLNSSKFFHSASTVAAGERPPLLCQLWTQANWTSCCGLWKTPGPDTQCPCAIPLESRAYCCSLVSLKHCKASASTFMSSNSPGMQEWVLKFYCVWLFYFEILRNDTKPFHFKCQTFFRLKSALTWIAFFCGYLPMYRQFIDFDTYFYWGFADRVYFGLFWNKQTGKQNENPNPIKSIKCLLIRD